MPEPLNFIMFGLGFVAERHLKVIKRLGHNLMAALDTHDSVGILDRYFPECEFFTEPERFDRYLYKKSRRGFGPDWATVCSPNWLHDSHCRMAMRSGANVICEKPVVINPKNIRELQDAEADFDRAVFVVHQLRHHPDLMALRDIEKATYREQTNPAQVELTYCTPRGPWYARSWKGNEARSGGIIMNLGIHFLDALIHTYGSVMEERIFLREPDRMAGFFDMPRAQVRWFLSTDPRDCPGGRPHRSLTVDGRPVVNFNERFADLHLRVYETALNEPENAVGLDDAEPAILQASRCRTVKLSKAEDDQVHPMLERLL